MKVLNPPYIISASEREDIPLYAMKPFLHDLDVGNHYSEWGTPQTRLVNGNFETVYPYHHDYPLNKDTMQGMFVWTKGIRNMLPYLTGDKSFNVNGEPVKSFYDIKGKDEVFPMIFQHTMNFFPKSIEPHTAPLDQREDDLIALSKTIPRVDSNKRLGIVLRNDPWIFSTNPNAQILTPKFYLTNLDKMMDAVRDHVGTVKVSFLDDYGKLKRWMGNNQLSTGLDLNEDMQDYATHGGRRLTTYMLENVRDILHKYGIDDFRTCAEAGGVEGVGNGGCIDVDLMNKTYGTNIPVIPNNDPNRKNCTCGAAVDIGNDKRCKHGCTYCYENNNTRNAPMIDVTQPYTPEHKINVYQHWNDLCEKYPDVFR